jgi:hypothetical protein
MKCSAMIENYNPSTCRTDHVNLASLIGSRFREVTVTAIGAFGVELEVPDRTYIEIIGKSCNCIVDVLVDYPTGALDPSPIEGKK